MSSSRRRSAPCPAMTSLTERSVSASALDDQLDSLVQLETSDRQHVIAGLAGLEDACERRRMVERLGDQAVVFGQSRGGVAGVAEQPLRFRERLRVEPNQPIAKPDVGLGMAELAVRRAAQIVNRAVLMKQPGHLVRMAHEIGRELRGDHEIHGLVVRLGQIDEPPQRRLREQFALRIGLERNRDFFRAVAEAAQLAHETADMPLGAAVDERHVRFTHKNGTNGGHRG